MPSATGLADSAQDRKSYIISITIIGIFFFIFGFVTWLNGILIPYLKVACELTNFQALFVAFAFYISYTVMALPSSWVQARTTAPRWKCSESVRLPSEAWTSRWCIRVRPLNCPSTCGKIRLLKKSS